MMEIMNPLIEQAQYKYIFVVQKQKDEGKYYVIHTSRTTIYRNLRLFCSFVATSGFIISNKDIAVPYIYKHKGTRDIYVKLAPKPIYQIINIWSYCHIYMGVPNL